MASATPDLRLPSRPQSITALWPVPNCTACWQRHMGVNNLPRVAAWRCTGRELNPSRVQHANHYTTKPPNTEMVQVKHWWWWSWNQHITATLHDTLHWLPVPHCSKSPWWRLTVFVVKDQATLMMSLSQFTLSELVHDCDLPIMVTRSSCIRAQFVSFSTAPVICTICVEWPSIWTEEQRH